MRGNFVPISASPVRTSRSFLRHFFRCLPSLLGLLFILSLMFTAMMNAVIVSIARQLTAVQRSISFILSPNQIVHQQPYQNGSPELSGIDDHLLHEMSRFQLLLMPILSRYSPYMIRANVSNDSLISFVNSNGSLEGIAFGEYQLFLSDRKNDTSNHKEECPPISPLLVGRIPVDVDLRSDNESLEEFLLKANGLMPGGIWEPYHCRARHKVAIIVPYRDRRDHLHALLHHLHPILQRQLVSYRIYVVEQFGTDIFNKGVLMNAGAREASNESDFNCFIFHDVDLIPEDDRNLYSCQFTPWHMSVAVDKFNYQLPYPGLVGGVFAISKAHFTLVNGYSNLYWGWGGEDDDMTSRLKFHNLKILRPSKSIARYTMIKHKHRAESPRNVRIALLRTARRRASRDGFNSVRYKIISRVNELLYSHILLEIDPVHKWHFSSPHRPSFHF
ncbi:beta-1,4-N-acetylgalactosaminyltransferase bre-4-like [Brevipalpus obovatus]|uniref:beta-1,4-N-acetylgalactosaminyltransferase bre-4-like n=1 Tax=Brevipalpus obovatus TaxID=246614 RepID=UPI003D9FAD4A